MKKLIALLLTMGVCFSFAACSSDSGKTSETPSESSSVSEESESNEYEQGDEISVTGQVAVALKEGDTKLSVQVQGDNDRWIIYHCEMKEEFVGKASEFKLTDVAKIKGSFLSIIDSEQENTAIIINLYDCEIVK